MAIDDPVRLINIMYNKEQAGTAIRNDEGNIIELTKENENYYTLETEKFKNEEETIDKYKKRFKERWKEELDKAVQRMKEEL